MVIFFLAPGSFLLCLPSLKAGLLFFHQSCTDSVVLFHSSFLIASEHSTQIITVVSATRIVLIC